MTVREALTLGEARLGNAGVEFARADVEWLLAHVTRQSRTKLILQGSSSLTDRDCARFLELLKRRAERVPLQHLVGSGAFLEHELAVSHAVLVPRPETEQLALRFIERLQQRQLTRPRVLDWGTGSGCLAIAVASAFPDAQVLALDQSLEALALARQNSERILGAQAIHFFHGNGFQALPVGLPPFDALISNPPYIPTGEIADLPPEVRDFEPFAALDGGPDGLDFYRAIAQQGPNFLQPGALAALEFGDGQASALCELFTTNRWCIESVEKDLSERDRVLIVHAPRR